MRYIIQHCMYIYVLLSVNTCYEIPTKWCGNSNKLFGISNLLLFAQHGNIVCGSECICLYMELYHIHIYSLMLSNFLWMKTIIHFLWNSFCVEIYCNLYSIYIYVRWECMVCICITSELYKVCESRGRIRNQLLCCYFTYKNNNIVELSLLIIFGIAVVGIL